MTDVSVKTPLGSRAVLRRVEAGSMAICKHCDQQVKFAAKIHRFQTIANVYVDGHWSRVEHFHEECYVEAGEAYGPVVDQDVSRKTASR